MKLKFCPSCASLDFGKDERSGLPKCTRCGYTGKMDEGTIDEINSHKKFLKSGGKPNYDAYEVYKLDQSNAEITENQEKEKEKLKSLKGKSTPNYEFL